GTIFTVVQVVHRIYVSIRTNHLQSIPPPSIFIKAKEREAIGKRRTGNIDQQNRENPGAKLSSPSRKA
ncbi:unnamed protein product, partial [Brassica rapa subsp. trilocularis]